MEQWKKVACSNRSSFLLHHGQLGACASLTWRSGGTRMHHRKKTSWQRLCEALGNVLLRILRSWHSPNLYRIKHLCDVLDRQICSIKASPQNLQDFKHLLLMSWCQTLQHTFRGLLESMPHWVRAFLVTQGETKQY